MLGNVKSWQGWQILKESLPSMFTMFAVMLMADAAMAQDTTGIIRQIVQVQAVEWIIQASLIVALFWAVWTFFNSFKTDGWSNIWSVIVAAFMAFQWKWVLQSIGLL